VLAINGANIQFVIPKSIKTTSNGSIGKSLLIPERMNTPAAKNCSIKNNIFMSLSNLYFIRHIESVIINPYISFFR
ncbi:MAG: hypothetical protein OQJ69_00565, partial [Flavobacteriales bacterium]|nr:hypothetical protein [Flavobacteriales bacterium]